MNIKSIGLLVCIVALNLTVAFSALAFGGGGHDRRGDGPRGGGGTPEPLTLALIAAGGAAAYGIKKAIQKKE